MDRCLARSCWCRASWVCANFRCGLPTTTLNYCLTVRLQLNAVNSNRCKGEHECWTSTLVATAFLGCDKPWEKLQFSCMLEGFMAPLKDVGEFTVTEVVYATPLTHFLLKDSKLALSPCRLGPSIRNHPLLVQLPCHRCCRRGTTLQLLHEWWPRLSHPKTGQLC